MIERPQITEILFGNAEERMAVALRVPARLTYTTRSGRAHDTYANSASPNAADARNVWTATVSLQNISVNLPMMLTPFGSIFFKGHRLLYRFPRAVSRKHWRRPYRVALHKYELRGNR